MTEEYTIRAFCQAGKHSGPVCGTASEGATTPSGWRMVPVTVEGHEWVFKADSNTKIPVCPDHQVRGEPRNEEL